MGIFEVIKSNYHNFNSSRELKKFAGEINKASFGNPEEILKVIFDDYNRFFWMKQVRSEFLALARINFLLQPRSLLEIGTAGGGSLLAFTKMSTLDSTIISMDLPEGKFGGGYPHYRKKFYQTFASDGQSMHLIRGDSHSKSSLEIARGVLKGNMLDFLFIDGDHTYEGVKKDYELYLPLVSENGVIAFHDIVRHKESSECNVHQFWQELKADNPHIELIEDANQLWAGIGVIFKNEEVRKKYSRLLTVS